MCVCVCVAVYIITIFSFIRELAYQIADQFSVFGKHIGLKVLVVVGGVGKLHHYDIIIIIYNIYRYDETSINLITETSCCHSNTW